MCFLNFNLRGTTAWGPHLGATLLRVFFYYCLGSYYGKFVIHLIIDPHVMLLVRFAPTPLPRVPYLDCVSLRGGYIAYCPH